MKVIFLQDVQRVGKRHDVKEVNDGYALNFLFPKKLAEPATKASLASLEERKKEIAIERKVKDELLDKYLEDVKGKTLTIKAKADEKGHLFSGIRKEDISSAMEKEYRAAIGEEFIMLEKPLKELGEFEIPIEIKGRKSAFKLVIER